MDNFKLSKLIKRCPILKFKCNGIWPSNKFPKLQHRRPSGGGGGGGGRFQIVNTLPSTKKSKIKDTDVPMGHWVLICTLNSDHGGGGGGKDNFIIFWDPLGQFLRTNYLTIFNRIQQHYGGGGRRVASSPLRLVELRMPLQNPSSNLCGLYCIYMAHMIFSSQSSWGPIDDSIGPKAMRQRFSNITEIELVKFANRHLRAKLSYTLF